MSNDNVMDRLRAARPPAAPPVHDDDALFAQTVAEPGDPRLATAQTRPARRWTTRPRILAGGSVGLVAIAAGVVLAINGSTAPPAFAITTSGDGSLLVAVYHVSAMEAAVQQLDAMHLQGMLDVEIKRGPAPVPGPIECSTGDQGQQVQMLLGSDGTDVVPAGVRGAGTWHLANCSITPGNRGSNGITLPGQTTGTTSGSTTGDTSTNGAG